MDRTEGTIVCHHPELAPFVARPLDPEALDRIEGLLDAWGTLRIARLPTGLVSAVSGAGANAVSGYDAVWLRDSVHVAHALWRTGDLRGAVRILEQLLAFQHATLARFDAVIEGSADPRDPQQRPHVRFDGVHLREKPELWAHAQNDALAYVVWLAASMWNEGVWQPNAEQHAALARVPAYFAAVRYALDADSGHWEEERRINASSVGTVVAALGVLADGLERRGERLSSEHADFDAASLRRLARVGWSRLTRALPHESPPERGVDAAVLFLIEPLRLLDDARADAVRGVVEEELEGPYGIRRYNGDSYWCADYRDLVAADQRSTDYSHTTEARDRLLRAGTEAQWCIFDPVLAVHAARRFARSGDQFEYARMDRHLRRALGQITGPGEWCAPGLCAEAYFLASSREGVWRPNDQTPLAWTQANLAWALGECGNVVRGG